MTTEQETAVRNYLTYLDDPDSLRDEEAIADLEARLEATDDMIEQLELHGEISELRDLPESRFLAPFIEHVKAYAETSNTPVSAFIDMGVKPSVLSDAGFEVKSRSTRRVTIEQVVAWATDQTEAFSKSDAIKATKGSPATVTRAFNSMIDAGTAERTDDDDPNHTGRGAKAQMYRTI